MGRGVGWEAETLASYLGLFFFSFYTGGGKAKEKGGEGNLSGKGDGGR